LKRQAPKPNDTHFCTNKNETIIYNDKIYRINQDFSITEEGDGQEIDA